MVQLDSRHGQAGGNVVPKCLGDTSASDTGSKHQTAASLLHPGLNEVNEAILFFISLLRKQKAVEPCESEHCSGQQEHL